MRMSDWSSDVCSSDLLVPSVVLLNPPFSRSQGRARDRHAALRHLRSALLRLAPGGRCAVILPDRIETEDADWLHATAGAHARLHLDLPPDAYAKHGTGQEIGRASCRERVCQYV